MGKETKIQMYTPESSPKNHDGLARAAKKELKEFPKQKYKMKVFLPSGKFYAELRASTAKKLKNSKVSFGASNEHHGFSYGEIKQILVQSKKTK